MSREKELYESVCAGRLEDVKYQLGLGGIDINWTNPDGWDSTILYGGTLNDGIQLITLLLEYGADINKANRYGQTPLYWASYIGNTQAVSLYLQHGADVDKAEQYGRTPLFWASLQGHDSIVTILLQYGADVNKADVYGNTPLHKAISIGYGHIPVITLLLEHGADVNKEDIYGRSPLFLALNRGNDRLATLFRYYTKPTLQDSLIMAVMMMEHLVIYHEINGTQVMIDFNEYL